MLFIVIIGVACGMITLVIAEVNERKRFLAFIAGFFLGVIGIAIYAIIGESIELRVDREEGARAEYHRRNSRSGRKIA